jgi:hypothetical protein
MNHYIFHAKSNNHHFPAFMDMIQRYMKAGLLHAQRSCTCCCGPMRLAFLPWPIRPNHFNLGEFQSLANQEATVPYSRYHDDLYWVCHSCWNYIHYTTVSDIPKKRYRAHWSRATHCRGSIMPFASFSSARAFHKRL